MTPGTKTRWRRDIAINLILVLAAVVVPLVALELYLAWDNRRPTVPLTTVELDGQKYPFEESADALSDLHNKAVIVGDSFTAGAACGLAGSYPGRLDRLLAQHGETYRVLNLGVPGSDPFARALGLIVWRRFEDGGAPWRPVYGIAYPKTEGVLGLSAVIRDLTGDGSDDVLVFAETGGSGGWHWGRWPCCFITSTSAGPRSTAMPSARTLRCPRRCVPSSPGSRLPRLGSRRRGPSASSASAAPQRGT